MKIEFSEVKRNWLYGGLATTMMCGSSFGQGIFDRIERTTEQVVPGVSIQRERQDNRRTPDNDRNTPAEQARERAREMQERRLEDIRERREAVEDRMNAQRRENAAREQAEAQARARARANAEDRNDRAPTLVRPPVPGTNLNAGVDADLRIRTPREAQEQFRRILGDVAGIDVERNRPRGNDREREVNDMVNQLRGNRGPSDYDRRNHSRDRDHRNWHRHDYRDHRSPIHHRHRGKNRALIYQRRDLIPELLIAAAGLNRVQIHQLDRQNAYELAYSVDEASRLTREDILFVQGSTRFADSYSAQIVENLAYAMHDPSLRNETFVIEGHASAEGSEYSNLTLSQRRAQTIAQRLVQMGIHPSRLVPVGYGESEALYRADSPEYLRKTDRRVVVYRLK